MFPYFHSSSLSSLGRPSKQDSKLGTNQNGQVLAEFLVLGPALIAIVVTVLSLFGFFWLRLQLSVMTQEFGVCSISNVHLSECQSRFQKNLQKLPGRLKLKSATPVVHRSSLAHLGIIAAKIDIQWGFIQYVQSIQEPIPWPQ